MKKASFLIDRAALLSSVRTSFADWFYLREELNIITDSDDLQTYQDAWTVLGPLLGSDVYAREGMKVNDVQAYISDTIALATAVADAVRAQVLAHLFAEHKRLATVHDNDKASELKALEALEDEYDVSREMQEQAYFAVLEELEQEVDALTAETEPSKLKELSDRVWNFGNEDVRDSLSDFLNAHEIEIN